MAVSVMAPVLLRPHMVRGDTCHTVSGGKRKERKRKKEKERKKEKARKKEKERKIKRMHRKIVQIEPYISLVVIECQLSPTLE